MRYGSGYVPEGDLALHYVDYGGEEEPVVALEGLVENDTSSMGSRPFSVRISACCCSRFAAAATATGRLLSSIGGATIYAICAVSSMCSTSLVSP